MIPAFVIGLREGVEATLIVSIIAAFLRSAGRRDALRAMWLGVVAAVVLCLLVAFGLELAGALLPQRKQEQFETIVALIAAAAVTYMVAWCRRNGPRMREMLQNDTSAALAAGSTAALVSMAFFAVLREGLETSVFLLAAFQQSSKPEATGTGAVLGLLAAVVLGLLLYHGGVRMNFARFFRITGVVLVLVAAGLVASATHSAHEAGWMNGLQGQALDLSAVIQPGSVFQALFTGMFGIQSLATEGEVAAWLLYATPMLMFVLWPRNRRPSPAVWGSGAAVVSTGVIALLVAGCGSGSQAAQGGSGGDRTITATVTDDGCKLAGLPLSPGAVTFKVTNQGAERVSEFEILDGEHIMGEVENLPDGLTKTFSLKLPSGTFTVFCPNAKVEKTDLVVGGGDSGQADAASEQGQQAVAAYRKFIEGQTDLLVPRVRAFRAAIKAGDVERAKSLFATAREPYERIEPVAESFGNLDPLIDARAGDVPASKWQGFHRIEQLLWVKNTTKGAGPLADRLLDNTIRLQALVQNVELQPAQIANGASSLLDEVATSKITGEEDRYSHTDLWDFAANVEGAQAAITAVRPILAAQNPGMLAEIEMRFREVDKLLAQRRDGDGYVLYTQLDSNDTKQLSAAVNALAEPISQVARIVVT